MENKPHILVVDDDDKIRNLLKEFLNAQDFYVTTASNAEDAEKKMGHFKYEILVLDVMMPGIDGYQFTKNIQKEIKSSDYLINS